MIIKNFDETEIKNVTKIFLNVYIGPPWNEEWDETRAEAYLRGFINNPSSISYLAYDKDQLIGACIGERKSWWQGDDYYINEIFIDKTFQKKGLGSSFLNLIQDELKERGIRTITLLTNKGTSSDNFYKVNGFKDKEALTFKYKNF